jgi:hypothetical protein
VFENDIHVAEIMAAKLLNAGQSCISANGFLLIVVDSVI